MLVPFIVNPDSLAGDQGWSPAQLANCHLSLIDVCSSMGLLIHDSSSFSTSKLQTAIHQLPQKIRPLWLEVLSRMPMIVSDNDRWSGAVESKDSEHFPGSTEVAFVDDAIAEVEFGLSEHDLSSPCFPNTNVEVCRIGSSSQSFKFKSAIATSALHIEAGESYGKIWSERFQNLARAPIKKISIVDRYAIEQQFKTESFELSGIARFLRMLNAEGNSDKYVTLFSAWTESLSGKKISDIESEMQSILDGLANGSLKRIKVIMVANNIFGVQAHDRFIRFEHFVWDMGRGLEVFGGAVNSKRSSASFKSGIAISSYSKIETELDAYGSKNSFTLKR